MSQKTFSRSLLAAGTMLTGGFAFVGLAPYARATVYRSGELDNETSRVTLTGTASETTGDTQSSGINASTHIFTLTDGTVTSTLGSTLELTTGRLELNGGRVENTNGDNRNAISVNDNGTVNIDGATVYASGSGPYGDFGTGVRMYGVGARTTIDSGSITGGFYGVRMFSYTTLNINGGSVGLANPVRGVAIGATGSNSVINAVSGSVTGDVAGYIREGAAMTVSGDAEIRSTGSRRALTFRDATSKLTVNGGSILSEQGSAIEMRSRSTLEMTDGFVNTLASSRTALQLTGGSEADISGGLVEAAQRAAVGLQGETTLNLTGGELRSSADNGVTAFGYSLGPSDTYEATVNASGGTINGGRHAMLISGATDVTVSGTADLNGDNDGIHVKFGGDISVQGGSVSGGDRGVYLNGVATGYAYYGEEPRSLVVSGGSINADAAGQAGIVATGEYASVTLEGGQVSGPMGFDINAGASLTLNGGAVTGDSIIDDAEGQSLSGSSTSIDGDLTLQSGATFALEGTLTADALSGLDGNLSGSGTLVGDLLMDGAVLEPGSSPGALTVNGDFSFAGTSELIVEIAGNTTAQQDFLAISGTADLTGGSIEFRFIDGFVPDDDFTFAFLSGGQGITIGSVAYSVTGGDVTDFSVFEDDNLLFFSLSDDITPPGGDAISAPGLAGLMLLGAAAYRRMRKGA